MSRKMYLCCFVCVLQSVVLSQEAPRMALCFCSDRVFVFFSGFARPSRWEGRERRRRSNGKRSHSCHGNSQCLHAQPWVLANRAYWCEALATLPITQQMFLKSVKEDLTQTFQPRRCFLEPLFHPYFSNETFRTRWKQKSTTAVGFYFTLLVQHITQQV